MYNMYIGRCLGDVTLLDGKLQYYDDDCPVCCKWNVRPRNFEVPWSGQTINL